MARWGIVLLALCVGCGRIGYEGDASARDAPAIESTLECAGAAECDLACPLGSGCRFRCTGTALCTATCTSDCALECSGSADCVLRCDGTEQRCTGPSCTLACGAAP